MQFRLLGPLEVEQEGRLLVLGSAKQRALLAILSLRANEVVSRDRLIDELWGERAPASALHSLDVYVSRLRKTLQANGGERLLVTRAGGYLLRLEPEQLDLTCFERLLEEGRRALAAGNYGRAAERLSEALALWRGPALADLAYEPFAAAEVERLEEQRLAALEERLEAELALGRHASLIGELEALSGKHPLRERLHGQLMLALYRCGRQAEALEVYRETRQHLLDEVGIDPSPALQRLEQAILRQDPALELPAPPPSSDDGRPPPVEPMAPRRGLPQIEQWRPALLALGVAGLIVAAVAGAIVFFTGSSGPSLSGVDANAVGIVDPKTGRITGEVQLDGTPSQVAAGAGSIWAVSPNRQSVSRIDSTTTQLVQTIPVGHGASGIAYGGGAVWVANSLDGTVSRIDPGTNRVVDYIPVGNVPIAVAVGFGSIWVTSSGDRAVVRLDARSGRRLVIRTGDVGRGIAVGDGAVWVSDYDRGRVSRIDQRSNEVTRIPVGNGPTALTYAAGALWVANELDGTVTEIDPQQNVVTGTVSIGGTPGDLAFADGGLWVSDKSGGRIVRVDREGTEVVASIETGNRPQGVALAAGRLWLPVQPAAVPHRGGTLRVVSSGRTFDSLDPAVGYDGAAWNVLNMLYDGLTAFQRVGNADGTKIVPDLAVSLPAPSDDGRTYIFQLRPGIHYSNGELVRPRDFRYGLERVFALHPSPSNRLGFYDRLRGAARCVRQPKRCDLSKGVVTDARVNTVTFHLVAPDPEFLEKLTFSFAAPVPIATPKRTTIVPTTGPYHIAKYVLRQRLELRRNPHFREWSKAATPDGYPDRISWTFLHAAAWQKAVRAVEQGRADVAFDGVPRELLHEVNTQYATQVHARPLWGVTYLFLNTRVPPFNDLRVRLAANYAADRAAALPASAQNLGGKPTCQILPPNFPGYRRYCPYTLHPGPSGVWKRPDLKRARRLVAASGTKGAPVTIWIPDNQASEGPIALALMRSLGYRTRLKRVDSFVFCCSARGLGNPRSRVQAGVSSWFADYPAAPSFIEFFSCTGFAHFCDRRIEADIRRALTLSTTDPYAANQLWAQIDHAIVDRAPVVPLITHKSLDFVSKRVGNYQSNPYPYGVLLDQLWVR
jgi:YVTN family beta-propeller protein